MSSSLIKFACLLVSVLVLLQNTQLVSASSHVENTPENCLIMNNEAVHVIMDRVCDLCHEVYSMDIPNLRAECRNDCFGTETFKKCLTSFTNQQKRFARHLKHMHHRH